MRRSITTVLVLLLVISVLLTGCQAAQPTAAVSKGPFKIAIVLPSPITDMAWGQAMYGVLKAVQKEMAAAALRDYATEGYNLVIAHGTQYGNSMFDVAKDFPGTSFAWGTAADTGASKNLKNVFAYEANAQEGGYVNGVIAAMLSKSGVLGVVGPVEAGDAKLYIDGFVAGATATKADIKVNISYTGSFGDTALAAEAANTHIAAGADVLTGSAQQGVGAIGVAKSKGVKWLGTQSDQSSLAPDAVVATQVFDWTAVVKDMIDLHQKGTMGGKAYTLTLSNGGLKIVFNAGSPVPDDVKKAAEQAIQAIKDGKIKPLP